MWEVSVLFISQQSFHCYFVVLNFGCNKKYARIIMCHVFIYIYIIYVNKLRSFFTENAEMLNLQKEKGRKNFWLRINVHS